MAALGHVAEALSPARFWTSRWAGSIASRRVAVILHRLQVAGEAVFARIGAVALCMLALGADAIAAERCETSKAGIKRCEQDVGDMKSVLYTDRAHDIVDFELTVPIKTDAVYPIALIGGTMAILTPKSTKEERWALLERLLASAGRGSYEFIPFGNYEWIASKTNTSVMIRASRKRK